MKNFAKTLYIVSMFAFMIGYLVNLWWPELCAALDRFMIRHKRKLTMVDAFGNVILHKYALLRHEPIEQAIRSVDKGWPNVFFHKFVWAEAPDGPTKHSHPGTTLSFMFPGGEYWEWYKGNVRHRKGWSIQIVKWPEVHKIIRVKPGTCTIFIRWFVRDPEIRVVPETCEVVCDWCSKNVEGGKCFNEAKEFKYDAYSSQFDSRSKSMKFPKWHYAGPELDVMIARRQEAMRRLGRSAPIGVQEQLKLGQKYSKLPILLSQEPANVDPSRVLSGPPR